jgi:hypothetical protein
MGAIGEIIQYPISNTQYPISKGTGGGGGTAIFDRITGFTGFTGWGDLRDNPISNIQHSISNIQGNSRGRRNSHF